MKRLYNFRFLGILVLILILALIGCGKDKDESIANAVEDEANSISKETSDDKEVDTAGDGAKEKVTSNDDSFDSLLGTYVYMPNDEVEERAFEIGRIADNYYIEYMGVYDYAAGEIEVINAESDKEGITYNVVIYPYSGFSFMGEYWGAGNKCSIIKGENGDITISGEQPYITNEELKLIRNEGVVPHEVVLSAKDNTECEELVGLWRCNSERDDKSNEITLEFYKNGVFKAENKQQDQTPMIYVGNYDVSRTEGGIEGYIICEAAGYGDMPYEWVLKYDENRKCPLIYDDYMYAEPFTYKEDDKNLAFKKLSDVDSKSFTPGPGARTYKVSKMYEEYMDASYKYGEDETSAIDELRGVWQLSADTPAGDPYIYQLEIKDFGMISFEGYSMAGDGWFQNYCFDGSINETIEETNDDSINVAIDISQLDENGTEVDSMSCEYSICYTDSTKNKISLRYVSGDCLIDGTDKQTLNFDKVNKSINPGDMVIEDSSSVSKQGKVPTDEEIRKLEEAITIFPVYDHYLTSYGAKPDISSEYGIVLGNWGTYENNSSKYAGLIFETGTEKVTVDYLDDEKLKKGQNAPYIRTKTDTFEEAMQDFFNVEGSFNRPGGYIYTVDDNYATLWGNKYKEDYNKDIIINWISFDNHMDGDTLVIDATRTTEDSTEKRYDSIRFFFEYNPGSFYGYSLINYDNIKSDHALNYSLDTIKDFEKYIRNYVNKEAKESDKVVVKAGVDGCPYDRWFYYNASTLLFAYYFNATDGSVDNRYYFMSGRMIEWIEGNGNDDSNRNRYYSCDSPLDSRWKETEKQVLEDSEKYR